MTNEIEAMTTGYNIDPNTPAHVNSPAVESAHRLNVLFHRVFKV